MKVTTEMIRRFATPVCACSFAQNFAEAHLECSLTNLLKNEHVLFGWRLNGRDPGEFVEVVQPVLKHAEPKPGNPRRPRVILSGQKRQSHDHRAEYQDASVGPWL